MARLLQGKVALVTGSGRGIGRGHALELARQGARVVVNDLGTSVRGEGSGTDAEEVADLIRAEGGVALADFSDVGDEDQVNAMVQRTLDEFGQLDVLVNNAGILRSRMLWNLSAEDYDSVMRVHARGTWLTCRAVARHWRERSLHGPVYGRVINTTSGAGLNGDLGNSNYAAAKAAIVGMSLSMSLEMSKIGVTVNMLGPAGRTRLWDTGPVAALTQDVPGVQQSGDPDDPAASSPVVAWLASPEAAHVTGQLFLAFRDRIQLMRGWHVERSVASGGGPWDPEELGEVFGKDLFATRAPGLRQGT